MKKYVLMGILALLVLTSAWAVSYQDFYSVFVDLPGWQASEPTGSKLTIPMGTFVQAERSYTQQDKSLTVRIVSGPPAMGFMQLSTQQFEYESPEEFLKNTSVKGIPGKIIYRIKERSGQITLFLIRFNQAKPIVMLFEFENMDYREALNIANKFPIERAVRLAKQL
ncbi:conserved hypothetical protein [Thermosulfidibacter takaii ABI70S6]|uniref:DUF1795 domain-containing protein n=1 Tax=Thermosulfidibacter takaii (strain DSM 17441 / JCM 13301 / NBRC 103674 / ABI70S6) TaxID=1298851 RepID=A0A0S3QTJ6_THET7|nr:hypothetical protein [Thermosulfidibacter takaii]BAT71646.1 conserved hypothetical protein [Thermosulfidibacter takaii ABI70S6]